MENFSLGKKEREFAELIWTHEPLSSRELVEICEREFEWKKSTTYTMLKRLSEKGLVQNKGGKVESIMSKDDFLAAKGSLLVNDSFDGSLPQFLAAFTRRNRLSKKDIEEIQTLIKDFEED